MNQNQKVVQHLERHGSINTSEAKDKYGIKRLPARIGDLRRMGHTIKSNLVFHMEPDGFDIKIAVYSLGA